MVAMPAFVSNPFALGMMLVSATAVVASVLAFSQARRAPERTAVRARVGAKIALGLGVITAGAALFGDVLLSHASRFPEWAGVVALGALLTAIPLSVVSVAVNLTVMLRYMQSESATRREWMMVACGSAFCLVPLVIVLSGILRGGVG